MRCAGYLKRTNAARLTQVHIRYKVTRKGYHTYRHEIHSDADWGQRKSVAACHQALTNPAGTFIPLQASAQVQGCPADSTTAAELIAAHYGVKLALPMDEAISVGENMDIWLGVDNRSKICVLQRGASTKLAHYGRAASTRISLVSHLIKKGIVAVGHVGTAWNRANHMTKMVTGPTLAYERKLAGLWDKADFAEFYGCETPPGLSRDDLLNVLDLPAGRHLICDLADSTQRATTECTKDVDARPDICIILENVGGAGRPYPKRYKGKQRRPGEHRTCIWQPPIGDHLRAETTAWETDTATRHARKMACIYFTSSGHTAGGFALRADTSSSTDAALPKQQNAPTIRENGTPHRPKQLDPTLSPEMQQPASQH